MSKKHTLKAQKRIQRIERDYAWLLKQAQKPNAHENYSITPDAIGYLRSRISEQLLEANKLHDEMNQAALLSTDIEVAALAGPGRKGGD